MEQQAASNVKYRCFNWADYRDVEKKEQVWVFGWQEITYVKPEFLYQTPDDIFKAASDFASTIPPNRLISITGGDNFYTTWHLPERHGSVIVWYWEESKGSDTV